MDHGLDRRQQLSRQFGLRNVAASSNLQCSLRHVRCIMLAHHKNLGLWHFFANDSGCIQSVEVRHTYIEQDDIRLEMFRFFNRIEAVDRLATDFPVGLQVKKGTDTLPDDFVVVGDQNSHWSGVCHVHSGAPWNRYGAASWGTEESLRPVALGETGTNFESPPSVGMKKENKEDPPEDPSVLPGETIWQIGIFHTVFPVGTKFTDFMGTNPLGSAEEEFAGGAIEIARQ